MLWCSSYVSLTRRVGAHHSFSQLYSSLSSGWTLVPQKESVRHWNRSLWQCSRWRDLSHNASKAYTQDRVSLGRADSWLSFTRMSLRVLSDNAHSTAAQQASYVQRCGRLPRIQGFEVCLRSGGGVPVSISGLA